MQPSPRALPFLSRLSFALALAACGATTPDGWRTHDAGEHESALVASAPLAARDDADAQLRLGLLHEDCEDVSADLPQTARWLERAAEQGWAPAQRRLGTLFEQGRGVPRDELRALQWYELAAARGDEQAAALRDGLRSTLAPARVAEARRLAQEWERARAGGPSDAARPAGR